MNELQRKIIDAALPNVVFDGWTMATLRAGAKTAGLEALEADRAFSGGVIEALNLWTHDVNRQLEQSLARDYALEAMKIRERIATAVMVKLRMMQPQREAVRRALAIYALPWHAADGLRGLYETVDVMWRAAGDTSTDWNFYSKRALLSKVYLSTLSVWLNDDSEGLSETEAFLRRRIDDVMQIQKAKFKLKEWSDKLTAKVSL